MAYMDHYGVDHGPKWTCANCSQPSGMMGHSLGLGFTCERPEHLLLLDEINRYERDLWELRNRNLGDARYDLAVLAKMRNRREYQWRRLHSRYGVPFVRLCNEGNERGLWAKVKGVLRRGRRRVTVA